MIDYNQIKNVHLEISTRCNASCPKCPRNTSGYDEDLGFEVRDMTLVEAKRIFTPPFLRQLKNILINGNFGDFVTAKDNLAIVEYFLLCNPKLKIVINTNGSGGNSTLWQRLGQLAIKVNFALDGLENTHTLYRKNTSWQRIINNAKLFISSGGRAVWKMIKFDHNIHQIDECRRLSRELGFFQFDLIDAGRDSGPVYDRNGNFTHKLGHDPHFINVEYPKTVDIWKEWTAIQFKPVNRLSEYKSIPIKQIVNCQTKQKKEIYIAANGEVYPCCWLGFYPKLEYQHPWQRDNIFIKDMVLNNNAIAVGIEAAINWFNSVEESWSKTSYANGRLFKCDEQCGKN
jgi:MoaA/NifB/PqqE/SkfB family radical SAM enzyme